MFLTRFHQNFGKGAEIMARTITVKGVGKATVKPDQVEISMTLKSKHRIYDMSMSMAAEQIDKLKNAFAQAEFEDGCLKTTDFHIRTDYDSARNKDGSYIKVFVGYECTHSLKLVFDFDTARLADALSAVAKSRTNPVIDIDFTVKNPADVHERVLRAAAENARKKAEILCTASGVKLGTLVNIDYNWGEVTYVSRAKYKMADYAVAGAAAPCSIDIDPDDIDAGDTAAFTWEIE